MYLVVGLNLSWCFWYHKLLYKVTYLGNKFMEKTLERSLQDSLSGLNLQSKTTQQQTQTQGAGG